MIPTNSITIGGLPSGENMQKRLDKSGILSHQQLANTNTSTNTNNHPSSAYAQKSSSLTTPGFKRHHHHSSMYKEMSSGKKEMSTEEREAKENAINYLIGKYQTREGQEAPNNVQEKRKVNRERMNTADLGGVRSRSSKPNPPSTNNSSTSPKMWGNKNIRGVKHPRVGSEIRGNQSFMGGFNELNISTNSKSFFPSYVSHQQPIRGVHERGIKNNSISVISSNKEQMHPNGEYAPSVLVNALNSKSRKDGEEYIRGNSEWREKDYSKDLNRPQTHSHTESQTSPVLIGESPYMQNPHNIPPGYILPAEALNTSGSKDYKHPQAQPMFMNYFQQIPLSTNIPTTQQIINRQIYGNSGGKGGVQKKGNPQTNYRGPPKQAKNITKVGVINYQEKMSLGEGDIGLQGGTVLGTMNVIPVGLGVGRPYLTTLKNSSPSTQATRPKQSTTPTKNPKNQANLKRSLMTRKHPPTTTTTAENPIVPQGRCIEVGSSEQYILKTIESYRNMDCPHYLEPEPEERQMFSNIVNSIKPQFFFNMKPRGSSKYSSIAMTPCFQEADLLAGVGHGQFTPGGTAAFMIRSGSIKSGGGLMEDTYVDYSNMAEGITLEHRRGATIAGIMRIGEETETATLDCGDDELFQGNTLEVLQINKQQQLLKNTLPSSHVQICSNQQTIEHPDQLSTEPEISEIAIDREMIDLLQEKIGHLGGFRNNTQLKTS